jgi:hypothetical protein
MNRRTILFLLIGTASLSAVSRGGRSASLPAVSVYRNPGCGCCEGWVDAMREAGFAVTVEDVTNLMERRAAHELSPDLASCHFAVSEGHVFEGHIPPETIARFLSERPANAKGLTVPGMPVGSPGMGPEGSGEPYDVLLLLEDGSTRVYTTHQT